jgi:hypothetical protein
VSAERVLVCPSCNGEGMLPAININQKPDRDPVTGADAASVKAQIVAANTARDGWQAIASALLEIAYGMPMKGFAGVPPSELIEPLVRGDKDKDTQAVIDILQAAMIGRAWRARGPKGNGTCDYPLCRNRSASPRTETHSVRIRDTNGAVTTLTACNTVPLPNTSPTDVGECAEWAQWIRARAASGAILIRS